MASKRKESSGLSPRDQRIRADRQLGHSLGSLGARYKITRERIRQICKGIPVPRLVYRKARINRRYPHGTAGKRYQGCRCARCRKVYSDYAAKRLKIMRRKFRQGIYRPTHGYLGYSVGCRCPVCLEGEFLRSKNARDSAKDRFLAGKLRLTHGKVSSYVRGCRCSRCRSAAVVAARQYRDQHLDATRRYHREYNRRSREADRPARELRALERKVQRAKRKIKIHEEEIMKLNQGIERIEQEVKLLHPLTLGTG